MLRISKKDGGDAYAGDGFESCENAEADRSGSTFYKYYTSKYNLMERYLDRTLERFRQQVDVAFVNAAPETIQDLVYQKNFEAALHHLCAHKAEYTLLWSIPLDKNVFGRMVDAVHDAILEKLPDPYRSNPYADLYARLFASDMMTLVRWWFQHEDSVTARNVQDLMRRNMKQGMFRTFRELMR